jgi:hypothetical protein
VVRNLGKTPSNGSQTEPNRSDKGIAILSGKMQSSKPVQCTDPKNKFYFVDMRQIDYSDSLIKNAILLLTKGIVPLDMPRMVKFRFRNRFLSGHYSVKDGKLLYDLKPVIPSNQKNLILQKLYAHPESARNGIHSFFDSVRQRFEGITRNDIHSFLKGQTSYQIFEKEKPNLSQPIVTHKPLDQVQIDYIDLKKFHFPNHGFRYALTMVDVFSKFLWVYPCKTREAEELKVCLVHFFENIKIVPKVLHSDKEFKTNIMRALAQKYGFRAVWSSAYAPNANSVVERVNGTLKRQLFSDMEK